MFRQPVVIIMSFKNIFDKLGLRGARWTWRATRWDSRLQQLRNMWSGERQQVGYRNKFCTECGALISRDDKECPHCHAKAEAWETQVARRFIHRILPEDNPVTGALIRVNVLIFLLSLLFGGFGALSVAPPGFRFLAMTPPLFFNWELWRTITYGYLHHGAIHILFNMFALSRVGPIVEQEIGSSRFFCLYTISLIGGGLLTAYAGVPLQVMAGASGALFGLIGFGAAFGHRYGGTRGLMLRNYFMQWIIFALIYSFMVPRISHTGHIGGLLPGAAMGWWFAGESLRRGAGNRWWNRAARFALVVTSGAFIWALASLFL